MVSGCRLLGLEKEKVCGKWKTCSDIHRLKEIWDMRTYGTYIFANGPAWWCLEGNGIKELS